MADRRKELIQISALREMFHVYEHVYGELSALKHIIFRATHLADIEALAVLFSSQIQEKIIATCNAVWLTSSGGEAAEIARDGAAVPIQARRNVETGPASLLGAVLHDQRILWPPLSPEQGRLFPGFSSPTLFPIKSRSGALGFFAIDGVGEDKRELCQWFAQFAAMLLGISNLHQEVKAREKELAEITEILFMQQSRLAAIHHLGMEIMGVADGRSLCRKLLATLISEFGADDAVILLLDGSDLYPNLLLSKDPPDCEGEIRFRSDEEEILKRCLGSGRIASRKGCPEVTTFGPYHFTDWRVFPLKGRARTHGLLVMNAPPVEGDDAIAIMLNQCGLALDHLTTDSCRVKGHCGEIND